MTLLRAALAALVALLVFHAVPAAAVQVGSESTAEDLVCTFPSFGLLMPIDSGTSSGSASSVAAGTSVFFQGVGQYMRCVSAEIAEAEAAFGNYMLRLYQAAQHAMKKPQPAASAPVQAKGGENAR